MAINELSLNLYSNAHDRLGDMAAKVAVQNFDLSYATLLFFNSTFYYSVEVFLRVFQYNLIVNMGTLDPTLNNNTRQVALFVNDAADIELLLDTMTDSEMDNTGKFIIVCESPLSNECDEKEVIELCWTFRIVDVVFIKLVATEVVAFTYYPYVDGICANLIPITVDCRHQCVNTTYGAVFGEKLTNLNLCPITVSTFVQRPYMNIIDGTPEGTDGDLLRMIVYGLNASLKIVIPSSGRGWGFRQDNGTWVGSLADIDEGLANFSITSAALTLTRFSAFEVSASYYTSNLVWVTHAAQLQNDAIKLLHPFSPDTRVALVVSFLLVIVCALLVQSGLWVSLCHQAPDLQPTKSIVFHAWLICMGQAITKLPTKSSWLQITFMWIWYCFLVRTVYQVYLISSLKGKFYEAQFETIEDAIKAKYPFGGGAALRDYYIDYPTVYDNWVNVDVFEIETTIFNMSKGMKFVMAMNFDNAEQAVRSRKLNLHILPQKIVTSPTVVFFKKYSPLRESINLILGRLTAAGFPDKLHANYTRSKADKIDTEGETLKMVHFTACYVILILGWILSTFFFLLEFYFGRIYQHPVCI